MGAGLSSNSIGAVVGSMSPMPIPTSSTPSRSLDGAGPTGKTASTLAESPVVDVVSTSEPPQPAMRDATKIYAALAGNDGNRIIHSPFLSWGPSGFSSAPGGRVRRRNRDTPRLLSVIPLQQGAPRWWWFGGFG